MQPHEKVIDVPESGQPQNFLCRLLNPLAARAYAWLKGLKPGEFPGWVAIETTSRCNLRCPICPRDHMKRTPGDMPPQIFDAVAEELGEQDAKNALHLVVLHFFGDPLMDPNIIQRIETLGSRMPNLRKLGRLRDPMRGLSLSTNALLLSEELVQPLLDSKLTWLGVSIDATTETTYRRIHGAEKWDLLISNVERLLEANAENSSSFPTIGLQIIDAPGMQEEIGAFRTRWEPYVQRMENVRVVVKPYQDWAGQIDGKATHSPWHFRTPCQWLWEMLVVASDGRVAPCCYDMDCSMSLGSIPEQSLQEIWRGSRLENLRQKMLSGDLSGLPLCQDCDNAHTPLNRLTGRR
ncbi:MAG: radical SAM protein [Armatimonadota bacterium]